MIAEDYRIRMYMSYIADLKRRFDDLKTSGIETYNHNNSCKYEIHVDLNGDRKTIEMFKYTLVLTTNEYHIGKSKVDFVAKVNETLESWSKWERIGQQCTTDVTISHKYTNQDEYIARINITIFRGVV